MPALTTGRELFFATRSDLLPGLQVIERSEAVEFVRHEARDDEAFSVVRALSADAGVGLVGEDSVQGSPRYLVFPRGKTPRPQAIPQRRGGVKYLIQPTSDCLLLRCGGSHAATGALLAGELQLSVDATAAARELFQRVRLELLGDFVRIRLYCVGPEALAALRGGRRLVTIGLASPPEYDLREG